MRPVLELGELSIPSYGLLVALAGLVFLRLGSVSLRDRGFEPGVMPLLVLVSLAGAWFGGWLASAVDASSFSLAERPSSGSSFLGGFLGALCLVLGTLRMKRLRVLSCLDGLCAPLALAYAVGRVGCLLAGDGCYGTPTRAPWGMSFPRGLRPEPLRVHPAPLYESLLSLLLFVWLCCPVMRHRGPGQRTATYLLLAGGSRFAVEFVRRNEVHRGLTQAQWLALLMMIAGSGLMLWASSSRVGETERVAARLPGQSPQSRGTMPIQQGLLEVERGQAQTRGPL